jgi:hypothetical protein
MLPQAVCAALDQHCDVDHIRSRSFMRIQSAFYKKLVANHSKNSLSATWVSPSTLQEIALAPPIAIRQELTDEDIAKLADYLFGTYKAFRASYELEGFSDPVQAALVAMRKVNLAF